jgi:hypothetical protein
MRHAVLLPLALLAACDDGGENARNAKLLRAARAGMNAVRGVPGGKTATFTQVRLVGATTVCGMIDGNDGDGPRPFSARGDEVTVADRHEPERLRVIAATCTGSPVHEITSRNPTFSDISVEN